MMSSEHKYDDEISTRSSKDDFKQQQFEARNLTKEKPVLSEQIIDAPPAASMTKQAQPDFLTTNVPSNESVFNAALAPVVQPSALVAEKSSLHHVEMPAAGEFGSIHQVQEPASVTFHAQEKSIAKEPDVAMLSQAELPSEIGQSAAAGFEAIKSDIVEKVAPQIEKAKEMYANWKSDDKSSAPSDNASAMDKAKVVFNDLKGKAEVVYNDSVAPKIEQATLAFNEQIKPKMQDAFGTVQRKMSAPASAPQQPRKKREYTTRKPSATEDLPHRLRRYRNKAAEIWAGEEPVVREYVNRAIDWIKINKLQVPAIALATLLTLWLSVSLIGWMAFPSATKANEQMVVYHAPQTPLNSHLPELINMGASQDVQGPTVVDRIKMKSSGIGESITDNIEGLKEKLTDRMGHIKDAMPSTDDLKMKINDRVHHMMPDMKVPSTADVKEAMPNMPSASSIKDSIVDVKDSVLAAMPSVGGMKAAASESMQKMRGDAVEADGFIKDDAFAPAHKHNDGHASANTQQFADDVNAPPHQHTQPIQNVQQQNIPQPQQPINAQFQQQQQVEQLRQQQIQQQQADHIRLHQEAEQHRLMHQQMQQQQQAMHQQQHNAVPQQPQQPMHTPGTVY